MKYLLLASIILMQMSLLSGCANPPDKRTPSLGGFGEYNAPLAPPGRIQQNNAINAQTMLPPVRN
jgi:hypothetical protein